MDASTDKKWFVYIGDKHEGPFTMEDLREKATQQQVTRESYVWAEGMPDWILITEISDLESVLQAGEISIGEAVAPAEESLAESPTLFMASPSLTQKPTDEPQKDDLSPLPEPLPDPEPISDSPPGKWTRRVLYSCLLLGAGLAFQYGDWEQWSQTPALKAVLTPVLEWAERLPVLSQWVSPIPKLDGVSPEELQELRIAARTKLDADGPKVALALSQNDPLAPFFYVGSNLPDGVQLNIDVVGVPETLLNQSSFSSRVVATLQKKLARTDAIRFSDGKPIPRGEYGVHISVIENLEGKTWTSVFPAISSPTPPQLPRDIKLILLKTYFLGGPRDATYASRLTEYHDKLRASAAAEIAEISQFAATLESQLNSTDTKFSLLHQGRLHFKKQKEWEKFHQEWMGLQSKLDEIFRQWTPQSRALHFFDTLYQLTLQTGQAIEKVHGFHHLYFVGTPDRRTFEIQLGEAVSSAHGAVTQLKAKVSQAAEKNPLSMRGLPRKDGI